MNNKRLFSSIAVSYFITSLTAPAIHAESDSDGFKCYGISGPGENDCDPLDHQEHTCGGASVRDHHAGDWKVTANPKECKHQGGLSEEQARKKLGLPPK